jgi:hypothetical protein
VVGAWLRLIVNSGVVATVGVAAQLGAGDALGIIRWDGPYDSRGWTTLLSWVAITYAVAVLAGALAGRAAIRRRQGSDGLAARLTASLVAAGVAAATIGLAWLPAQFLQPPTNVDPGLVVSLTAGAGVMVGLVLAVLALAARPIAVGLQATVAWVWLVAIGGAIAGLTTHEPYQAPRVGVPDAPSLLPSSPWAGARVMIVAAVLVAIVVAGVARWRGSPRLGAALAGFGGPALVAASYLVAGPGPGGEPGAGEDPYLASLLATAAGLMASVLVAMPGRRAAPPPRPAVVDDEGPLEGDVVEPVRAWTPPAQTAGPARPAWAGGSGPYARAYTSAGAARTRANGEREHATPGDTSWAFDTRAGTAAGSDARHARESATSGLYRSTGDYIGAEPETGPVTTATLPSVASSTPRSRDATDALSDPHESWLRDLGPSGRHAAPE